MKGLINRSDPSPSPFAMPFLINLRLPTKNFITRSQKHNDYIPIKVIIRGGYVTVIYLKVYIFVRGY
jgi:hypothetical protein